MAMTEEEKKKRRELLMHLFLLLLQDTENRLKQSLLSWGSGEITAYQFRDQAHQTLLNAHAHAAHLGRNLAGKTEPFGELDVAYGKSVMVEQSPFLNGFTHDLQDGKYTDSNGVKQPQKAFSRAALYVKRLRGTANEAWVNSLADEVLIDWGLGQTEDHCQDCPVRAANSPYTKATLPGVPGDGSTECLSNCDCTIKANGEEGFPPVIYTEDSPTDAEESEE